MLENQATCTLRRDQRLMRDCVLSLRALAHSPKAFFCQPRVSPPSRTDQRMRRLSAQEREPWSEGSEDLLLRERAAEALAAEVENEKCCMVMVAGVEAGNGIEIEVGAEDFLKVKGEGNV
jgi:hypothetical protein